MKKNAICPLIVLAALMMALSGCGGGGDSGGMEVEDAWARAVGSGEMPAGTPEMGHGNMGATASSMTPGMNSAAYMIIRNKTDSADRLLRVESDVAEAVELHQTLVENEVMTMRPVGAIDLPAGGQAVLEPGGLHIMLIGLKQPLSVGQKVSLKLVFEKTPPLMVEAEVRQP